MKRVLLTAFVLVTAVFVACTPKADHLTCKIDGEEWSMENEPEPKALLAVYDEDGALVFGGVCGEDFEVIEEFRMWIAEPEKGTFELSTETEDYVEVRGYFDDMYDGWWTDEPGAEGSITITKLTDDFVAGKFEFTGVSFNGASLKFEEGSFKLPILTEDEVEELFDELGTY